MLTPEQIVELKSQLYTQIENLPEDKRQEAKQQIDSLSPEALQAMLNEQRNKGSSIKSSQNKGVFRMIIDGEIKTIVADENEQALAVLDINPISQGHIIIIPRTPVTDARILPIQAFALAKKIGKRICTKFKAKSTEIQTESKFGEVIINVIPVYEKEPSPGYERKKASLEQLEEIAKKIRPLKKPKIEKIKKKENSDNSVLRLERRVP